MRQQMPRHADRQRDPAALELVGNLVGRAREASRDRSCVREVHSPRRAARGSQTEPARTARLIVTAGVLPSPWRSPRRRCRAWHGRARAPARGGTSESRRRAVPSWRADRKRIEPSDRPVRTPQQCARGTSATSSTVTAATRDGSVSRTLAARQSSRSSPADGRCSMTLSSSKTSRAVSWAFARASSAGVMPSLADLDRARRASAASTELERRAFCRRRGNRVEKRLLRSAAARPTRPTRDRVRRARDRDGRCAGLAARESWTRG